MPKPYKVQDKYFKKAKEEGYKARSAFKLKGIQEKFKILRKGDLVLDVGAAPGSFLQYTSKVIGPKGKALGLDLQEIDLELENIETQVCDIYDEQKSETIISEFIKKNAKSAPYFDAVISDIAPKTTGIKDVDQWNSVELNRQIVEVAKTYLKRNGNLLMKVFQGADFDEFLHEVKPLFKKVKVNKPDAVRDRSFEVYLVCTGKV